MRLATPTPWERFCAGETPYGAEPVRPGELAELYWSIDCTTTEIIDVFDLGCHPSQLAEAAGPAKLTGICCHRCEKPLYVFSRTDLTSRVKDLAEPKPLADWADPAICRECKTELYERRHETFRNEQLAYERRRNELRFMPYRDYLQTPEWKQRADTAKSRVGFRCQTCAGTGQLHVHHRTYVRRGDEWNKDLIVLCADCHGLFHKHGKLAEGGRAA